MITLKGFSGWLIEDGQEGIASVIKPSTSLNHLVGVIKEAQEEILKIERK